MQVRRALLSFLAAAILIPASQAQTKLGAISGTVVGDDGKPLAATVTFNHIGAPPTSGRSTAAADGSFSVKNLPAGSYSVCAVAKAGGYLNPCTWAPLPPVAFTAGQNLAAYRIVLKKGLSVQVRLNDSAYFLEAAPVSGKKTPQIVVGTLTSRHVFEPLALLGKDSAGRTHQGIVPLDQNSLVHIRGVNVRLTDSAGAP